jgi:hypothetical protein
MARHCIGDRGCQCGADKDADGRCVVTPSGPHLKSHRDFLAPRMPERKWLRMVNPYRGWKLWRDWTPPEPLAVQTSAEVLARQLAYKPAGYAWKLWHQHNGAQRAPATTAAEDTAARRREVRGRDAAQAGAGPLSAIG